MSQIIYHFQILIILLMLPISASVYAQNTVINNFEIELNKSKSSSFQKGVDFFNDSVRLIDDNFNHNRVLMMDINGDNQNDFVLSYNHIDSLKMYIYDKNSGEYELEYLPVTNNGELVRSDLDSDNEDDIILYKYNEVSWIKRTWAGQYEEVLIANDTLGYFYDLLSIDIDKDGDMDIISANYKGEFTDNEVINIVIWYNNGDQQFSPSLIESYSTRNSVYLAAGYINGDEHIDMVVSLQYGSSETNVLYWLENNGSQEYCSHFIESGELTFAYDPIIIDFDQDGMNDIMAIKSHQLHFLKQNENQEFESINLNILAEYFEIADLNSNNNLEIITNTYRIISVYQKDDNQDYIESRLIEYEGFNQQYFILEDLNQDSDLDIIYSDYEANSISWFENTIISSIIEVPIGSMDLIAIPNPFKNETQIHFTLEEDYDVVFQFYDMMGRLINETSNKKFPAGKNSFKINRTMSNGIPLKKGTYFCVLRTKDKSSNVLKLNIIE